MSGPPILVVLDAGTSVVRAALYRAGRLVTEDRRSLSLAFPAPGRVEQDPREIVEAAEEVLANACEAIDDAEHAVLGITNQRSTVILWDADTGRAFGPALSWRDARAVEEAAALARAVPDLAERTGLHASPHYGAPKIAWALAHWPEARAAAKAGRLRVGPVSTWIAWKLTHGESFAVDPSNAQRMLLMNLRQLEWDDDLARATGLDVACLPQLRPTDGHFGEAKLGGRKLPVRAMLGDQQAVLAGLDRSEPGRDSADIASAGVVAVQLGTGGFVLRPTGENCLVVPGLLSGLLRADANQPRRYLLEGPISSAGSALDRLRDMGLWRAAGHADEDLDTLCASATAPLTVVPAWAGLAAPWWEPSAGAAILGWTEASTRADVVAGTVNGIAFLVADIVDVMTAASVRSSRIELSGPLSASRHVAQAISDATRLPVRVRDNPEASLEGIACLLAEATGALRPVLSLRDAVEIEPGAEPVAARDAFATARQAALRMAARLPTDRNDA